VPPLVPAGETGPGGPGLCFLKPVAAEWVKLVLARLVVCGASLYDMSVDRLPKSHRATSDADGVRFPRNGKACSGCPSTLSAESAGHALGSWLQHNL